MKIYTKTGDKGQTSLFGGNRVSKHNIKIETYGTIDELMSYLGLVRDFTSIEDKGIIVNIQNILLDVGAHLATPSNNFKAISKLPEIKIESIEILEKEMDIINDSLPKIVSFVLPGGHPSVSHCHVARSICRRAERRISELNENEPINPLIIKYINRLSDYLFVLSRKLTQANNVEEIFWTPNDQEK